LVDDLGPDGMRAEVERRLGYALPDFALPPHPGTRADHLGVTPEHENGVVSLGVPVHVGLLSGEQMLALADVAERLGRDLRVTRQQNIVVTGVAAEDVDAARASIEETTGLSFDANPIRGGSIACTGEPHCNFSVTETKTRLDALIQELERRFGEDVAPLRLALDGCPHACAHHWVGDIGFQGSTVRDDAGKRQQAYEVYLRGGLGAGAAIGRALFRRVPTDELDGVVGGLVAGWLDGRQPDESFQGFADRLTDAELGALVGREPAAAREAA
jgi:ferredoxin-nitrite reductase